MLNHLIVNVLMFFLAPRFVFVFIIYIRDTVRMAIHVTLLFITVFIIYTYMRDTVRAGTRGQEGRRWSHCNDSPPLA